MTNRAFGSKEDQGWVPSQNLCIVSNKLLTSTDCQDYTAFMKKKEDICMLLPTSIVIQANLHGCSKLFMPFTGI